MEQLNKIEIRGIVGFTRLQTVMDKQVLRLSVVTNFAYQNKEGEPVIETTWHFVNAWEGRNMPDLSTIAKGDKVHITGRLRSQKYTGSDGVERSSYEIIANKIELILTEDLLQCEF